jgi:hypothetical protein
MANSRPTMKAKLTQRNSKITLILFALLFAGIGSYFIINSFAATAPTKANLWVDLSGQNNCVRQDNPANYSDANACGSFSEAFLTANCGDLIYVKGTTGNYAGQQLLSGHASDSTHPCAEIIIAAAPNETVNVDDLVLGGANNIRIAGAGIKTSTGYGVMNIGKSDPSVGSPDIRGGTNVTIDGINYVSSGQIVGGTNVTVENSDIGPFTPPTCPGSGMPIGNNSSTPVKGLTFNNNYVHDYRFTNCTPPNDHLDCIHVFASLEGPSYFEGNKIENCQNYGILMEGTSNAYIRNNWFGSVVTNCGFAFHGGAGTDNFSDITIESNSATSCITPQTTNNLTNVIMRGNIASNVGGVCRSGITYSYNKQTDGGSLASNCGTGDATKVSPNFVNTATGSLDLHLKPGSSMIDAGGSVCPSVDFDGLVRPSGAACDAGASEYGSSTQTAQKANLWVNTTAGSSPSKCDIACAYDSTHAYGSFNAAYQAALPGQTILIRGGNYGAQQVAVVAGRGSSRINMLVEPGQVATVNGDISINADFVTVGGTDSNGLKVNGSVDVDSDYNDVQQNAFPYNNQVEGVTLKNVDANRLDIRNTKDLTALNGDWGPINNIQSVHFDGQFAPANSPSTTTNFNTIIDGGSIHDSTRDNDKVHTECVAAWSVVKLTIRNVHFYNCSVYNISATRIGSSTDPQPSDYLIENNIFEATDNVTVGGKQGYYTNLLSAWEFGGFGIHLFHNYMEQQFELDQDDQGKMIVANNIMPKDFNCSDTTYIGNAMARTGNACSGNTTIDSVASQVVNPAANDFHLKAGVGAIGSADIAYANTTDRDGNPRDASPDAGPYEYQSGTTPTCTKQADINCDNNVNVTDLSILLSNYGKTTAQLTSSTPSYPRADINNSGKVDIGDLSALLTGYGK